MSIDSNVPILSFPAILRNPGLNNRYAHLHGGSVTSNNLRHQQASTAVKKKHRDQNEGKRWVRRKDNSRFVSNPHIIAATKKDYVLPVPQVRSTFPEPLPAYLSRNVKLPTTPTLPETNPNSANAGRFSLSLKGMRKDLRRAGGRAQALVRDVETEVLQWLTIGGTVLSPDTQEGGGNAGLNGMGTPVGTTGTIFEVSRTPLQLVWRIAEDAFARYVVHCCSRYHEIVSFSKGSSEERLTYLLRPNVTRPDRRAPAALETPPVTDIDYSSNPETDDTIDSDFISENDMDSDIEMDRRKNSLSAIDESPNPSPMASLPPVEEDSWSQPVGQYSDAEEFESSSEFGGASVDALEPRLASLSLQYSSTSANLDSVSEDPDKTVTEIHPVDVLGESLPRRREWGTGTRSPSSPSRSPARGWPTRRRRHTKKRALMTRASDSRSFYEYLFM